MLDGLGERIVKNALLAVAVALSLAAAATASASASELHGRWAVDPADCHSNRYVWIFAGDRAGLFVDNSVVSGWRRATYRDLPDDVVAVAFDGLPRREFRWRFRGPDEIAAAAVIEDGRSAERSFFQVWRRCEG